MFGSGHKASKLKIDLRLSINRLKLAQKKKTEQAQKSRKEIAEYLAAGKYERARIRVEHIIREDYLVEAMEVVELYCDLLLARFGLIESMKYCDEGLSESISSIIWVAPRMQSEINELKGVSEQLILKYGKAFGEQARANSNGSVNERLVHRMSVEAPPRVLVEQYLVEIAKSHKVPYEADPMALVGDDFNAMTESQEFIPTALPSVPTATSAAPAPAAAPPVAGFPGMPARSTGSYPGMAPPAAGQPQYPQGPGYPATQGMPSGEPARYEDLRYPGPHAVNGGAHVVPHGAQAGVWVAPGGFPGHAAPESDRAGPLPSKADLASQALPQAGADELGFQLPSVPGEVTGSAGNAAGGTSAEDLDFDDLSRRFEDLKRRK